MATYRTGLGAMLLASLFLVSASAKSPIGWRTDGTGCYSGVTPPTVWAEDKNVLWKLKLPGRSQGSPIIVGDRIYVVSDPAELLCVNAADGAILWKRSCAHEELFGADKAKEIAADYTRLKNQRRALEQDLRKVKDDADKQKEIKQQLEMARKDLEVLKKRVPPSPTEAGGETTNTAATPVSDGKHIYTVFGNGIVAAFTVSGERQWFKYLEAPTIGFGLSSSPALVDGKLIVHLIDLFALDAATGDTAWRQPLSARHASPIPAVVEKTPVVISPAGAVVRVSDGKVLLKDGALSSSECSPVLHEGIVYTVPGGARAVRLVAKGEDAVKLEKVWESRTSGGRRTPSPVLHGGLLYGVTTGGILEVLDAATGEQVYQQRLGIGELYSSATAAGDYLYFGSTSGTTLVLAPGRQYREIAKNKVEGFGSCPVFRGRHMVVRTRGHLYCIGP